MFWLRIWYESIVWVIMGCWVVFTERRHSSCSSYNHTYFSIVVVCIHCVIIYCCCSDISDASSLMNTSFCISWFICTWYIFCSFGYKFRSILVYIKSNILEMDCLHNSLEDKAILCHTWQHWPLNHSRNLIIQHNMEVNTGEVVKWNLFIKYKSSCVLCCCIFGYYEHILLKMDHFIKAICCTLGDCENVYTCLIVQ